MDINRSKKLKVAVVIGLLVVTTTAIAEAQEVDLVEQFTDPALPGWEHSPNAVVVDGVLQIGPGGFAYHSGGWADLHLNVRARLEGDGHAELSYRLTDEGEYRLQIRFDQIVLLRGDETLASENTGHIQSGEWFPIEVFVIQGHNEVLLNDELVLVAVDPDPLPAGSVALSSFEDMNAYFDDLSVLTLDPDSPETQPGSAESEAGGAESGSDRDEQLNSSTSSETGELEWVRTGGPPGGIGYDIRYKFNDPEIWFVTDNFAGVHRSMDNGLTWSTANNGIPGQLGPSGDWRPIFSLTVDPLNPDVIWAGTDKTGRIYKSTDGGESWVEKDNGVLHQTDIYDALSFRGFTIDPNDSNVVYAMGEIADTYNGGAEVWTTATGGVVYKTSDGGENWELLWDGGIPSSLARYLWIDPRDTDILYVSTGIFDRGAINEGPESDPYPYGGLGILKSTNGGETWRVLDRDNGLDFLYVGSLFMHPDDPDILLAATGKYETDAYRAYLQENNLETEMGLYRTTDGGETWEHVLASGGGFTAVEICPSDTDIAYVASGNDVYRSDDSGLTWLQVAGQAGDGWGPPGVLAGTPIDMQCDPRDPDRIFTNNYLGGNFLSEDGGLTWKNASDGYTGAPILSVAVDPHDPAKIYAGGRAGLWKSKDGGTSWQGMRYPPEGQPVWGGEWGGVTIDPSDPSHLLASEETIWESFDEGQSWLVRQTPAFAAAEAIVFAPSNPDIVYTGRADPICLLNHEAPCNQPGFGVYISRDGGSTWEFANDETMANQTIIDLAVDPYDAQSVYAATMDGLYHTADGGASWMLLPGLPEGGRVGAIAIHPLESRLLLAGVELQGLFASEDGGQTWSHVAAGLEPNTSIRDILYDPTDPEIVYLSDLLSGVYQSKDGGKTWKIIDKGLSNRSTTGLGISSDGEHLYVATSGEGVFRLDLNGEPPAESVMNQPAAAGEALTAGQDGDSAEQSMPVREEIPGRLPTWAISAIIAIVVIVLLVSALVLLRRNARI